MSRHITFALLALPLVAAACASSTPGADEGVKIAFIQDLSAPDADEHVQPALQAAELAVAMRAPGDLEVTLVPFDLAEDPSAAEEIASDPAYVAAIVGPGADGSQVAEEGVPTVSVSTAGPTPSHGAWRRFVAPMDGLADVIAGGFDADQTCLLSEDPPPDALAGLLAERLGIPGAAVGPEQGAAIVAARDCDVVAWAGSPDPGAELARALGGGTGFQGGDRLLDPDFAGAGPWTDGARAVCACVDISTSIESEAMRLVQDYQSEFGTAPGPYAVEAWDAARALLAALDRGQRRQDVAGTLRALGAFEGLAGAYGFAADGELADTSVGEFELAAGRWVVLGPSL